MFDTISYSKHFTLVYLGISCLQKLQGISFNLCFNKQQCKLYALKIIHLAKVKNLKKKVQVILANLEKIEVFARIHYNDMQDLYNSHYVYQDNKLSAPVVWFVLMPVASGLLLVSWYLSKLVSK